MARRDYALSRSLHGKVSLVLYDVDINSICMATASWTWSINTNIGTAFLQTRSRIAGPGYRVSTILVF